MIDDIDNIYLQGRRHRQIWTSHRPLHELEPTPLDVWNNNQLFFIFKTQNKTQIANRANSMSDQVSIIELVSWPASKNVLISSLKKNHQLNNLFKYDTNRSWRTVSVSKTSSPDSIALKMILSKISSFAKMKSCLIFLFPQRSIKFTIWFRFFRWFAVDVEVFRRNSLLYQVDNEIVQSSKIKSNETLNNKKTLNYHFVCMFTWHISGNETSLAAAGRRGTDARFECSLRWR